MARKSRMSVLKRQRELKKSEKATRKRARRHGLHDEQGNTEPRASAAAAVLFGGKLPTQDDNDADRAEAGSDED